MAIELLVTSPICENKYGGPVQSIYDHLSHFYIREDININLLGVVDDLEENVSQLSKFPHKFVRRQRPLSWSYSKDFNDVIVDLVRQSDVVHTHMLRLYDPIYILCSKQNKDANDFVPHGSVSGLHRMSSLKKRIYKFFLLSSILKSPSYPRPD